MMFIETEWIWLPSLFLILDLKLVIQKCKQEVIKTGKLNLQNQVYNYPNVMWGNLSTRH